MLRNDVNSILNKQKLTSLFIGKEKTLAGISTSSWLRFETIKQTTVRSLRRSQRTVN